jgi:ribosomal-protein-alanine N-acetyltransferase
MIKFKADWPLKKSVSNENRMTLCLEGERVLMRPAVKGDYRAWHDVRLRNKNFLSPFEPAWAKDALSEDFFKRRLVRQNKEMLAGRGLFFLVFSNQSKAVIGGFNFNNVQYGAARSASLGYWLDEGLQGNGYMSETAQLAMEYAFKELHLRRLNAACLPNNHRSAKLLLKLGFEEEGFAKKYLQINGKWQDHRLFGKTYDC